MELSELASINVAEDNESILGGEIQNGNKPTHTTLRVVEQPEPQNYSRYFEIPKYDKETKKAHAQRVIQDAIIDFFDRKQDEQEDGFFYTIVSPKGHGSAGGELIKHIYDGALEQGVDLGKPGIKVIFREVIIALEESGYLETATDDRSAFTKIRPRDIDEFTASEDEYKSLTLVERPVDKPLLKGAEELGDKTQFTLTYPKRIRAMSVAGKVFNTIYAKPIIVYDTEPDTIAESVKRHSGSKKSVQELTVIVRDLMLANNILTEQAEDGKFRIKVADKFIKEVDVKKAGKERTAYKELKFDYDGLRVHLDSADLTDNLALEDLTLARMLYSTGFREGGISQEDALKQFITGVGRRDEGVVRDILADLENKLLIQPNGDGNQHLTQEGEEYIIRLLHWMDCIDIAGPYIEPEELKKDRREHTEENVRGMGGSVLNQTALRNHDTADIPKDIAQHSELSRVSREIINELAECLESIDAAAKIDTSQVVLGIDNKEESQLVCDEISSLINQFQSGHTRWDVKVFIDSTTKEHVPVVISTRKPYDVEQVTGSLGMLTSRFRLQVVGKNITLHFTDSITIKDIMGLLKMDSDLEAMSLSAQPIPYDRHHTRNTINSGINGLVHLEAGKLAHYPVLTSQSEWVATKSAHLLAEAE